MENSIIPSRIFTPGPHTSASLETSEWKLVTKKHSGAATIPRESGGHKTAILNFGKLKLPYFSMEKSGQSEKSENTWKKKENNKLAENPH